MRSNTWPSSVQMELMTPSAFDFRPAAIKVSIFSKLVSKSGAIWFQLVTAG